MRPKATKFVISRDVDFDDYRENPTAFVDSDFQFSIENVENVDDTILSHQAKLLETEINDNTGDNVSPVENSSTLNITPEKPSRRSLRIPKPPGECWKSSALKAEYSQNTALATRVIPVFVQTGHFF